MNVSDLIGMLETFKRQHGDLPVRLYTDHGQTHMHLNGVGLEYTEDLDEYMSEPVHKDDAEEDTPKICEVYAQ